MISGIAGVRWLTASPWVWGRRPRSSASAKISEPAPLEAAQAQIHPQFADNDPQTASCRYWPARFLACEMTFTIPLWNGS